MRGRTRAGFRAGVGVPKWNFVPVMGIVRILVFIGKQEIEEKVKFHIGNHE
jgi:hypothetical protein